MKLILFQFFENILELETVKYNYGLKHKRNFHEVVFYLH